MLWMDSDGFSTKPWEKDPVDYFIKNNGVIMFTHFQGSGRRLQGGILEGFNKTICSMKISPITGELEVTTKNYNEKGCYGGFPDIHGFFHITDLDFYRSPVVTKGLDAIFGDCFLCRSPDDQDAVTVPAAILAPERSWGLREKGFHLDVFHNYRMDGIDRIKPSGFKKRWAMFGPTQFPQAYGVCKVTEAG